MPREMLNRLTPPELRGEPFARQFAAALLFALFVFSAIVMLVTAGSGCGAGAKGCAVVDATKAVVDQAHDACVVLRYLDEGGTVREEHVTLQDIRHLGAVAHQRAAASAAPPIPSTR